MTRAALEWCVGVVAVLCSMLFNLALLPFAARDIGREWIARYGWRGGDGS